MSDLKSLLDETSANAIAELREAQAFAVTKVNETAEKVIDDIEMTHRAVMEMPAYTSGLLESAEVVLVNEHRIVGYQKNNFIVYDINVKMEGDNGSFYILSQAYSTKHPKTLKDGNYRVMVVMARIGD